MPKNNVKTTNKPQVAVCPLGDRLIVEQTETVNKTEAGIVLPESVSQEAPKTGVVVAVGKGRRSPDTGEHIPLDVQVGDSILFSHYGPEEVVIENKRYLMMNEANVLAVFEEDK